jgi:hypothetical protein
MTDANRTRLALMLPGAVSLGAYEGGALAAILVAVLAAEGELVVDAIASASAGSITGLIASRALVSAADPVELMKATWVDLPDLGTLKTHDRNSPLSMQALETAATRLLEPDGAVRDGAPDAYRQAEDVRLSMAITVLGGLTYRIARLEDPGADVVPLEAQTFTDWFSSSIPYERPGMPHPTEKLLEAVPGALASGSTPVGFPPRLLDRSDPRTQADYESAGIVDPAAVAHMWCSDGGDLDNAPFGRLIDLISDIPVDPSDDRAIVVLQMAAAPISTGGKWFDPDEANVPTWTSTLLRVNHLRSVQGFYDDLKQLEKTNTRLGWLETVGDDLTKSIDSALDQLPSDQKAEVSERIHNAIQQAVRDADAVIDEDLTSIDSARRGHQQPRDRTVTQNQQPGSEDLVGLLKKAAGFGGKEKVHVELIAPDPKLGDPSRQLAGEFLFHFGGFFDVRFRQSDFALGFENAEQWLGRFLPSRVSNPERVLAAVHSAYEELGWKPDRGGAGLRDLTRRESWEGIKFAGHLIHVAEYGFRHDVSAER